MSARIVSGESSIALPWIDSCQAVQTGLVAVEHQQLSGGKLMDLAAAPTDRPPRTGDQHPLSD